MATKRGVPNLPSTHAEPTTHRHTIASNVVPTSLLTVVVTLHSTRPSSPTRTHTIIARHAGPCRISRNPGACAMAPLTTNGRNTPPIGNDRGEVTKGNGNNDTLEGGKGTRHTGMGSARERTVAPFSSPLIAITYHRRKLACVGGQPRAFAHIHDKRPIIRHTNPEWLQKPSQHNQPWITQCIHTQPHTARNIRQPPATHGRLHQKK
jgi:hypothetical protein